MNIATLLFSAARSFADRPAVSLGTRTALTYRDLARRTASLAAALSQAYPYGDLIAIALPNCMEYLEILYGVWTAGMATAPLSAKLAPAELAFMIEDCGAKAAFVSADLASDLALLLPGVRLIVPATTDYVRMIVGEGALPAPRQPQDPAWIFYTSGTTGKPKGALLSHGNLFAMAHAYFADIDFLNEQDTLLHLAATSHASGLFALSHIAKASNNVLPESGGFDATEFAGLIDAYDNVSFFVPPTLLRRIGRYPVIAGARLDHVKTVLLGAAPVAIADIREGRALFGEKLWNGYGQGESPCTITAMSKTMIADALRAGDLGRLASVGIARTGIELGIVDSDGHPLAPGEIGEVVVRGATVMQGYLNRPEASAETVRDGWLQTGDIGRVDEAGFLTLLDRKKDVIISGGVNIYAREVEDALGDCADILEIAVIGIPDAEWGESVMAVIVPTPGKVPDTTALDRLCLERLARFKRPKRYAFVEALPRNASGKVLKAVLRNLHGGVPA